MMFICHNYFLIVASLLLGAAASQPPDSNLEIPYLISSIETSQRQFACPGESVSFSCAIHGPVLIWRKDREIVAFFTRNNSIGDGFAMSDDCFLYSAVLNQIERLNDTSYICYSTLTITPGNLDDNLTLVQPCNLTNVSSTVSCSVSSSSNRLRTSQPTQWSTTYNIAGIYNIIIIRVLSIITIIILL